MRTGGRGWFVGTGILLMLTPEQAIQTTRHLSGCHNFSMFSKLNDLSLALIAESICETADLHNFIRCCKRAYNAFHTFHPEARRLKSLYNRRVFSSNPEHLFFDWDQITTTALVYNNRGPSTAHAVSVLETKETKLLAPRGFAAFDIQTKNVKTFGYGHSDGPFELVKQLTRSVPCQMTAYQTEFWYLTPIDSKYPMQIIYRPFYRFFSFEPLRAVTLFSKTLNFAVSIDLSTGGSWKKCKEVLGARYPRNFDF